MWIPRLVEPRLRQLDSCCYPITTWSRSISPAKRPDPGDDEASHVATSLERDLRSQLQVSHLLDFKRVVWAVALRSAQLLNRAVLARDVGISGSTAGIWLSLPLERTRFRL